MNKTDLRKTLRNTRQQISLSDRLEKSQQIAAHFVQSDYFKNNLHIAGYLSADGEVETTAMQMSVFSAHKKYYLPILHPLGFSRLWFSAYHEGDSLVANKYKILEPALKTNQLIAPWNLDVVLVPLVGFDEQGNRLGMGKGFYDQTFHFLRSAHRKKPCLIGVAYEAQKVDCMEVNDWDIPLRAVITEKKIYPALGVIPAKY